MQFDHLFACLAPLLRRSHGFTLLDPSEGSVTLLLLHNFGMVCDLLQPMQN